MPSRDRSVRDSAEWRAARKTAARVVQQIRGGHGRLLGIELRKPNLRVGVDEVLLVDPTDALERADIVAHVVRARSAILDGEIACLGPDGRSRFYDLLFRREWPHFLAFDAIAIDGTDLRNLPLTVRKRRLAQIMPRVEFAVDVAGTDCATWPPLVRARLRTTAPVLALR